MQRDVLLPEGAAASQPGRLREAYLCKIDSRSARQPTSYDKWIIASECIPSQITKHAYRCTNCLSVSLAIISLLLSL